ncbi:MAG TPA: hypothetical protein VFE96_01800, partial [Candidatus Bathyarchaeia archaeon]|nr:hypothetical protein [Candidatus Bathyarchaeia archaeon]
QLQEAKKLISRTFDGIPIIGLSALKGNNTGEVVTEAYHHLNGPAYHLPSGSLELRSSPS